MIDKLSISPHGLRRVQLNEMIPYRGQSPRDHSGKDGIFIAEWQPNGRWVFLTIQELEWLDYFLSGFGWNMKDALVSYAYSRALIDWYQEDGLYVPVLKTLQPRLIDDLEATLPTCSQRLAESGIEQARRISKEMLEARTRQVEDSKPQSDPQSQ